MNPSVSVIIPTYNRCAMLLECLESILSQEVPPTEVIVVDDGSTDDTLAAVGRQFGSRVILIPVAHSGLPSIGRNIGVARARGEYIALCDSDDYWKPEKLSRQFSAIRETGANFCCSDALIAGTDHTLLCDYRFRFRSLKRSLRWENFVILSSVMMHRSLSAIHPFPVNPKFRGYEDYRLWLSLLSRMNISFIPEPLVVYRTGHENLSREYRSHDVTIQLRILFSHPTYLRDPFLGGAKFLRYALHAARR
jgi:glycosyltransferase involved in cell wall biosynthesis